MLMLEASLRRSPAAPLAFARSLPARSTKHILLVRTLMKYRQHEVGSHESRVALGRHRSCPPCLPYELGAKIVILCIPSVGSVLRKTMTTRFRDSAPRIDKAAAIDRLTRKEWHSVACDIRLWCIHEPGSIYHVRGSDIWTGCDYNIGITLAGVSVQAKLRSQDNPICRPA